MLGTLVRRSAQQAPKAFNIRNNPYKAKRTWPPDFSKLSERHQFRLERKYKRRSKLKWARPKLMVATKLAQWIGGISILVYGVLFMQWEDDAAFSGARQYYKETMESIWSNSTSSVQQPRDRNQQAP